MAGHYNRFSHTDGNKVKTCWTKQELFLNHIHQKTKTIILRVTLALSKMTSMTQQHTADWQDTLSVCCTFITNNFNPTANLRTQQTEQHQRQVRYSYPFQWLELQTSSMTLHIWPGRRKAYYDEQPDKSSHICYSGSSTTDPFLVHERIAPTYCSYTVYTNHQPTAVRMLTHRRAGNSKTTTSYSRKINVDRCIA